MNGVKQGFGFGCGLMLFGLLGVVLFILWAAYG
jgi:hypothetical protein